MGDHRVDDPAAREAAGAAHDEHHSRAAVVQCRLRVRERQSVVGGAHDQRVVGEPLPVELVQDRPDALVERAGARLERRHVLTRGRGIREVLGGQRVEGVPDGCGGVEAPMGLEEAHRHEERAARGAQALDRGGRDVVRAIARHRQDLVIPDDVRVLGDVLLSDQYRVVAGLPQRMDEVLAVVVKRPTPVGQAQHPVVVAVLAGQQRRAATGAGGRRAEGLAKKHALVGQELDVRRRDLEPVWLHVPAGVVRVDVEDVGWHFVDNFSE